MIPAPGPFDELSFSSFVRHGRVHSIHISLEPSERLAETTVNLRAAIDSLGVAPDDDGSRGDCSAVERTQGYSAVCFEYARNGEAMTHVLGEIWTWDGNPESCPDS